MSHSHPSTDVDLWQRAVAYACFKHRHQLRKDGRTPYVSHVMRVAMTIRQVFGFDDPATIAAAFLHDTIEDTTTDYDDLAELFGKDVANLVAAMTKNAALPEPIREPAYDAQLAQADWRARLIKLADAYDNLCDVKNNPKGLEEIHKTLERARRALALAKPDVTAHPAAAVAYQALENLLKAASARSASRDHLT